MSKLDELEAEAKSIMTNYHLNAASADEHDLSYMLIKSISVIRKQQEVIEKKDKVLKNVDCDCGAPGIAKCVKSCVGLKALEAIALTVDIEKELE